MFPSRVTNINSKNEYYFKDTKCVDFDGTADYLELWNEDVKAALNANNFILSMTFNGDADGGYIFWNGVDHDEKRFAIEYDSGNSQLVLHIPAAGGGSADSVIIPGPVANGVWYKITLLWKGGLVKAILGRYETLPIRQETLGSSSSVGDNQFIGKGTVGSSTAFFNGKISDFALYNNAGLKLDIIHNKGYPYNHYNSLYSNNLVSWLRMGDTVKYVNTIGAGGPAEPPSAGPGPQHFDDGTDDLIIWDVADDRNMGNYFG